MIHKYLSREVFKIEKYVLFFYNPFFNAWVSDQNSIFGDNCESVSAAGFVVSKSQGQATLDFASDRRLTKSAS